MTDRLQQQMDFIMEIDKLKSVYRQSYLSDLSRHENSAEHSWHLAVMALLLSEHAEEGNLDVLRVIKMLLVHDLVEIDAGDTFAYDEKGQEDKAEREQKAANRLFDLLPADQGRKLMALWHEFERQETPEARFANALDRLHPMLQNAGTRGEAWRNNGVNPEQVRARAGKIADGSAKLGRFAEKLIIEAAEKGYFKRRN